jgi:hypothetical protein
MDKKNIVVELLINIISFLPSEYISICKSVCKSWIKNLKSNLSKKILTQIPLKIQYSKSFEMNSRPLIMYMIKNDIYINDCQDLFKIDTKSSEITEIDINIYQYVTFSNGNYICKEYLDHINIFFLNIKLISSIKISEIQGLAIDNKNNILISTNNKFQIYNLKGKLTNSWNLIDNSKKKQFSRKIEPYKNEIFMLDTSFDCVRVFSYEGKQIRSWGIHGDEPGNFKNPWGITIYYGIVFVVDMGNNRI